MRTNRPSSAIRYRVGGATALLAISLLAAGCGGSSSPKAASTPAASTASTPAATTSPAASTASTTAASPTAALAAASGFCGYDKVAASQDTAAEKAFTSDTPTELGKYEASALAEAEVYAAKAPSAIRGSIEVVLTATRAFVAALQAAGDNYSKLPASATASFDTPAVLAASKNIDNYLKTKCGVTIP